MRFRILTFLAATVLAFVMTVSGVGSASNPSRHGWLTFAEASKHVGTTQCVRGTVLHVEDGSNGMTFLNFSKKPKPAPLP